MKTVILCGGGGTRLFPLSRESFPKQFLSVNGESFLQKTYRRAKLLCEDWEIAVSTNRRYFFIIQEQLGEDVRLIMEPTARNTAAAFLYAVKEGCESFGWSEEDVFAFLPTDHEIRPDEAFAADIKRAADIAASGRIVVLGVPPDSPKTGYGYIKAAEERDGAFEVERFVEKPSPKEAERMLEEGGYFWNSGIYVAKGSLVLEELARVSPEFAPFVEMETRELKERFSEIPATSIDYALAEKTDKLSMVPASFFWSDVGSWDAFYEIASKDENQNAVMGKAVSVGTRGCLIHGDGGLPVVVGMEDAVVVSTKDVVLVAKKGETQRVKEAVALMKEMGYREATEHARVYRPWGYYETLLVGDRFKVKRIFVKPGKRLSLQMHHHRAEHWVVVRGTARVVVGEKEVYLHENESVYVPKSVLHRIENVGRIPLEIVEVQTGEYVEEDDIIRLDDDWGREAT